MDNWQVEVKGAYREETNNVIFCHYIAVLGYVILLLLLTQCLNEFRFQKYVIREKYAIRKCEGENSFLGGLGIHT